MPGILDAVAHRTFRRGAKRKARLDFWPFPESVTPSRAEDVKPRGQGTSSLPRYAAYVKFKTKGSDLDA
jgi:hypothetical protein